MTKWKERWPTPPKKSGEEDAWDKVHGGTVSPWGLNTFTAEERRQLKRLQLLGQQKKDQSD